MIRATRRWVAERIRMDTVIDTDVTVRSQIGRGVRAEQTQTRNDKCMMTCS